MLNKKTAFAILVIALISYAGYHYLPASLSTPTTATNQPTCCTKTKCTTQPKASHAMLVSNETQPKGCVFQTIFKEESAEGYLHYKTPQNIQASIEKGLKWAKEAQQASGGWGAGLGSMQHIRDPHAVNADPATTSMVAMALLRCGSTLTEGEYSTALVKATNYLLKEIESTKKSQYITTATGTQIQGKLGQNIDAVITAQYFSNLLTKTAIDHPLVAQIKVSLDICVKKIQDNQEANGRTSGGSWAGVLQSSMANSALEAATVNGAVVDQKKLEKAKNYQESNYDYNTGTTNADDGAGILLYSMSGSVRASASGARDAREQLEVAKKEGKIAKDADVSVDNLKKIGYSSEEATKLNTSYKVYESAKVQAQSDVVMNGFGNNGGEEFISFLQTGESMLVSKDDTWKKWYDNVSAKMLAIQNADGSWNGHHCITSPSFCTATCLLIMSINNDAEVLMTMGKK